MPALATTRILTPSPNAAIATIVNRLTAVAAGARASCGNSPAERSAAKPRKPTTNQGTSWCNGRRPCAGRFALGQAGRTLLSLLAQAVRQKRKYQHHWTEH